MKKGQWNDGIRQGLDGLCVVIVDGIESEGVRELRILPITERVGLGIGGV